MTQYGPPPRPYKPVSVTYQEPVVEVKAPERKRWIPRTSHNERQTAAVVIAVFLAAVIPLIVGAGLVVLTAWLVTMKTLGVIHTKDIHATVFGWLTDWEYHTDRNGVVHRAATPNTVPLAWFTVWATIYMIYQLCELVAWPVRAYRNMVRENGRA